METFEVLGLSVKLSQREEGIDPREVFDCVCKEIELLPAQVKKKSAAQQLLLVALKIASDKLVLKNQLIQELTAIEQILMNDSTSDNTAPISSLFFSPDLPSSSLPLDP